MTIMRPWLTVIGIEEDGLSGLSSDAVAHIERADVIFGGKRHLAMLDEVNAEHVQWSVPFSDSIVKIQAHSDKNVVVLASGDPQWFGIGSVLAKKIDLSEFQIIPARSSFSLAASQLAWSLANVQTLTLHGRAFANIARWVFPSAKLLVLSNDGSTPAKIAEHLAGRGFGQSKVHVMEHLGGTKQRISCSAAAGFDVSDIADLNIVGVECIADSDAHWHSAVAGLPDDAYIHDGQLTKSVVRAATLSALRPFPGGLLWDVGAGCGSIGIEWMRAAPNTKAIAIEPNPKRLKMIAANAAILGVPNLKVISGKAPVGLMELTMPDAIFIGGGFTQDNVFETCWQALSERGVLVVNAVTLESETRLFELHQKFGGTLTRTSVEQVAPMGSFRGWQQAKPVTQWQVIKTDNTK
jgi:precorrin-6Y C5,15-methyltransferase (decarboxylating)